MANRSAILHSLRSALLSREREEPAVESDVVRGQTAPGSVFAADGKCGRCGEILRRRDIYDVRRAEES
jgi:hypothetical protein